MLPDAESVAVVRDATPSANCQDTHSQNTPGPAGRSVGFMAAPESMMICPARAPTCAVHPWERCTDPVQQTHSFRSS